MKIKTTSNKLTTSTKDTIFLGFFEGEAKHNLDALELSKEDSELLKDNFKAFNFQGKSDQGFVTRLPSKLNCIVFGLGLKENFTLNSLRRTIASAVKSANKLGAKELSFSLQFSEHIGLADVAKAITEASIMSQYKFETHKTDKSQYTLETLVFSNIADNNKKSVDKAAFEGQVFGEMNLKAREFTNTIPQVATPSYMADAAKKIAKENNLSIKILSKQEMQSLGMNGILSVGQGSRNEPKLVIMEYKGTSPKKVALVGKGVCFDAGGLDIKGAANMETMKSDKAGAVAVMVAMEAIAKLKPKTSVVGLMPFVENLVSDTSYKPGDIVKTMSGKTIEVLNTDAEGRIVLSDALYYGATKYNPDAIVDIATLTGAVVVALGSNVAGIMSNDKVLTSKLIVAGTKTYERLWELPMFEDYNDLIKSDHADMKNVVTNGPGGGAGTIVGAVFLQNFIADAKWAHLDIAGTDWCSADDGYNSKGSTAFGVRLLTQFILDYE